MTCPAQHQPELSPQPPPAPTHKDLPPHALEQLLRVITSGPIAATDLVRYLPTAEAAAPRHSALLNLCARALAVHILAAPEPVPALLYVVRTSGCGVHAKRALLAATGLRRQQILAYVQARLKAGLPRSCSAGRSRSLQPRGQQQHLQRQPAATRALSAPAPRAPGVFSAHHPPRPQTPLNWRNRTQPAHSMPSPGSASSGSGRTTTEQRRLPGQHLWQQLQTLAQRAQRVQRVEALCTLPPLQQQGALVQVHPQDLEGAVFTWLLRDVQGAAGAVNSPVFKMGGQEWRLVAHPQGLNNRGRHLSLYLSAVGCDAYTPFSCWRQRLLFTFSVVGPAGACLARSEAHTFDAVEHTFGFTAFATRAQLLDAASGLMRPDGALLLRASCLPMPLAG